MSIIGVAHRCEQPNPDGISTGCVWQCRCGRRFVLLRRPDHMNMPMEPDGFTWSKKRRAAQEAANAAAFAAWEANVRPEWCEFVGAVDPLGDPS